MACGSRRQVARLYLVSNVSREAEQASRLKSFTPSSTPAGARSWLGA